ncbi:MAG: family penicillin-binding protein [Deltaproteobacteria bacterium]|nr:family penicillin-binding protein [Deltaproteobacteria bacterium]
MLRALLISAALLAFGAGILAARTLVGLDRIVRNRFEGRLFQVASRVYSAPTMLTAGLDLARVDLRNALHRLGYRDESSAEIASPGGVHWESRRVVAYLRAFEHPSRAEPARRIELRLAGKQIESIRDLDTARELAGVLLEPELVGSYFGPHREQREPVRLGQVPRLLIDAVLAVEDQRFEAHPGIDPWRIFGAAWANLVAGEVRQGGSTLTQQLVKNFFLTPERSLERKLKEAAMSLLVEARYEKPAILEAYLNEIYLGQRGPTSIHGVGEASLFYFGKPVRSLRLEDAALLAGLISSPGNHSPFTHPEDALARRDLVLQLMLDQGRIDAAAYAAARAAPLSIATRTTEQRETRYFLDALRSQLPDVYDEKALEGEGLRIYSTLDLRLQQIATEALREGLENLEKKQPKLRGSPKGRLQGCLVVLRPQTGDVLALVGGREYGESQFDRCLQARRSAGSAFKPFVYVAGLEAQRGAPVITLASTLEDTPISIKTSSGNWSPVNYDHKFHGRVGVRHAFEKSLNVATVRLAREVGTERIVDVARRLGIESPLDPVPALALGAADVTPLELARAYATLANGGVRSTVRFFEDLADASGRTLERSKARSESVLDPGTSYLAVSLLQGVVDRGTAHAVRDAGITGPVAGKTGTSDESKDAWFAGFTPELVAVVWVGFDQPRGMKLPAASLAVPIWLRFLRDATGGAVPGAFEVPSTVHRIEIDPSSGAVALAGCPRREQEYFIEGTEPRATCPEGGWFVRGEEQRDDSARGGDDAHGKTRPHGGWLDRLFGRLF